MSLAFKIMAFAICLNIASGILGNYAGLDVGSFNKTAYQSDAQNINTNLGGSLNAPSAQDNSNFIVSILNFVSFGLFSKVFGSSGFISNYLFGLTSLLVKVNIIEFPLKLLLDVLLGLVYGAGLFSIVTGRQILGA